MHTEHGKMKIVDMDIFIVDEDGDVILQVTNIETKNVPAPHLNAAIGWGHKPRGKKPYRFIVKLTGQVLVTIT
jgi:hypothetical protein